MDAKEAFAIFRQEAAEHLQAMETLLLQASEGQPPADWLNQVFRLLHTIKGSAGMFGLERPGTLSHLAESVFDRVRSGDLPVDEHILALGLKVKDELASLLEQCCFQGELGPVTKAKGKVKSPESLDPEQYDALVLSLELLLPRQAGKRPARPDPLPAAAGGSPDGSQAADSGSADIRVYRIVFRPDRDLLRNGTNPLMLLQELGELGHLESRVLLDRVPTLEYLDPEEFHLDWEFTLATSASPDQVKDLFIFVDNGTNLEVSTIREGQARQREEGRLSQAGPARAARTGPGRAGPGGTGGTGSHPAVHADEHSGDGSRTSSYIRVHTSKLQELLDAMGELTVFQEKFRTLSRKKVEADTLGSLFGEIEGLTRRLGNLAIEMNMVNVGSIFTGFQRLVRDLGQNLGKQVRLELSGTETELDKTIADGLREPLMHLIRNSMDHGLESPAERKQAGKPETGVIHIKAAHSGGSVMIAVRDDGRGMDLQAIERKARERGLLAPDQHPGEEALLDLVFLPGFSTASQVSDVSGRGVGMDVVKSSLEAVRGSVHIQSRAGQGTTTTLSIPLTLALVDVLVTRVGEQYAAFILEDIAEVLDPAACPLIQTDPVKGRSLYSWRGQPLSCLDLEQYFGVTDPAGPPAARDRRQDCLIVLAQGERHFGLLVGPVVETSQGMIKPLDQLLGKIPGVSGSLLFGEGNVAWVINSVWFLSSKFAKG